MSFETTFDITEGFSCPFYGGVGSTNNVPDEYDVAINGRPYMLDTTNEAFRAGIQTIPFIRRQADTSEEPGESTINPEDLWPRAQSSWHKGAGQEYLDAPDSDRQRFRSSLGIDPWERGKLKLQRTTEAIYETVATNLQLVRVGTYTYVVDGNDVKHAQSPYSSWTSADVQAGEAAQSVKSIASDGYNVWAALGSNGVHATTRGASSSSHYSALSATLVAYVKGRLMAANGNAIYNIVASGAAPSALFTHPNSDFSWVGFAEGQGHIYAAGYSGDKSLIYRTAVKADGTALDTPVVAGELPDGEIIRSIVGYLGYVVVGTNKGFRLAQSTANGELTFGAFINTGTTVRSFEPQDRFIWFGWENYDGSHTGLGRMDLSIIFDNGAPAYATDLMANEQGSVLSIATDPNDKRVFAVSGQGYFIETDDFVTSGTIDSGHIGFGVPDPKIALRLALKHEPLPADSAVTAFVSSDQADFVTVGESAVLDSTAPFQPLKVPEVSAHLFEVRFILTGGAVLERYDFRAYPSAVKGKEILLPILLHEQVLTASGKEVFVDIVAERAAIESLSGSRQLVSLQDLGETYSVFVEQTEFQRHKPTQDRSTWNGTLVVKFKALGE